MAAVSARPWTNSSLRAEYVNIDHSSAPSTSKWSPPKWMLEHASPMSTPRNLNSNGLGDRFDPKRPMCKNIDLVKPDERLKIPDIEIACDDDVVPLVAFVDANILDSTGNEPYRGDVLVRGKRIETVGTKLPPDVLSKAAVINANGRTLMSGMCDAHTHVTWTNSASLDGLAEMPIEEHTIFSMRSAKTFLDCGYTMCLGAASAKQRIDCAIRNSIKSGDISGPRYLANGKEITPPAGALAAGISQFAETSEELIKVVNDYADQGLDSVKFSMSGEEITETLRAEDTTFSDEMVQAGVEAAHARGLRVCSHARSDESIQQCLQYGVDIIYHASFISDATMAALEVQKDRVFVAPALAWLVGTLEDAEKYGYPNSKAESVGYARELEIAVAGLKEMKRRGIRVLPGGDYGFAWTPHGTYRDPELFVKRLGYTPMESIIAATALGGEIMMHPHELGKVQPNYYADLILVNGNPLEDISLLSHHQNLDVVMINGRIHKHADKERSNPHN